MTEDKTMLYPFVHAWGINLMKCVHICTIMQVIPSLSAGTDNQRHLQYTMKYLSNSQTTSFGEKFTYTVSKKYEHLYDDPCINRLAIQHFVWQLRSIVAISVEKKKRRFSVDNLMISVQLAYVLTWCRRKVSKALCASSNQHQSASWRGQTPLLSSQPDKREISYLSKKRGLNYAHVPIKCPTTASV